MISLEKYRNQERENWLHPTVAVRHSDSHFDCDISAAWLHLTGATAAPVLTQAIGLTWPTLNGGIKCIPDMVLCHIPATPLIYRFDK